MKRYIKSSEAIFGMATVGVHRKPDFMIAVNPGAHHKGLCYFKYYNSDSYMTATQVTRINLRAPAKVFHRNRDGKKEWNLNTADKNALYDYLLRQSDSFKSFSITNWQYVLYLWNNEYGLLNDPYPDEYGSRAEAFIDGYYDEANADDPSYVASDLTMPDYRTME